MLAGKIHNLRHLGFSDFVRIDTADSDAFVVDVEHDAGGIFLSLVEKPLQDEDHKLHRREVVVQQQDFVERRLLGFRPGLGDNAGFSIAVIVA